MSFSETLTVRFRDTDSQGHMFFANYQVFASWQFSQTFDDRPLPNTF